MAVAVTLTEDDLNPTDKAILKMLRDGRCTAAYIASEQGYTKGNVRNRLARLVDHNHVEKIYDGLYELRDDPR